MKALIQIHIYGGRGHLATLSKHDDIPTGIYSDKPVNSLINLTPTIKADVKFQIDKVSFEDDSTSLLVSERRLQISQLLPTLGIQNFTALMNESELYGWSVEKYIDGINHYFYIGLDNLPMFSSAVFSEVALKLILFFLMATTPAVILMMMDSEYLVNPYWIFMLFVGITFGVYFLSFGILRHFRGRGKQIY